MNIVDNVVENPDYDYLIRSRQQRMRTVLAAPYFRHDPTRFALLQPRMNTRRRIGQKDKYIGDPPRFFVYD